MAARRDTWKFDDSGEPINLRGANSPSIGRTIRAADAVSLRMAANARAARLLRHDPRLVPGATLTLADGRAVVFLKIFTLATRHSPAVVKFRDLHPKGRKAVYNIRADVFITLLGEGGA